MLSLLQSAGRRAFVGFAFDAAFEGFRVMRREPKAVLSWIGVWVVVLAAIAMIKVLTAGTLAVPSAGRGPLGAVRSFGPFAAVLVPTLLVFWIMTTATVFRSVLRPEEHGWHLLKLGPDEARMTVITAVGFVLMIVLGSVPALVLLVLVKPIFAAVPGLVREIADVGAVATVCVDVWIATRLSLVAVETFAEGRFPVSRYWRLTRGHFWRLLASYALVVVEIVALGFVLAVLAMAVAAAGASLQGSLGGDLGRRLVALGGAVLVALISAILFVIPTTIISACQAFAYRTFAGSPEA